MRDRSYKYISGMDEDAQDGRPGCNGQEVDEAERKEAEGGGEEGGGHDTALHQSINEMIS